MLIESSKTCSGNLDSNISKSQKAVIYAEDVLEMVSFSRRLFVKIVCIGV